MGRTRINVEAIRAVAARLRQVRKEKNLTQMMVQIDTDYDIGRIERGENNITISTLVNLCDYYGVTLEEFFRGVSK